MKIENQIPLLEVRKAILLSRSKNNSNVIAKVNRKIKKINRKLAKLK